MRVGCTTVRSVELDAAIVDDAPPGPDVTGLLGETMHHAKAAAATRSSMDKLGAAGAGRDIDGVESATRLFMELCTWSRS